MASLFWVQLCALIWKNWIVLSKNPFLTILRCVILPIAYGFFLGYAQIFLHRLNNYGFGNPAPILSLHSQFDGKTTLMWVDSTNGLSSPSPTEIMKQITSGFAAQQLAAVKQVAAESDIPTHCPLNFNGFSSCYAGIAFTNIPPVGDSFSAVNYTIYADAGLNFVDVEHHTSSFEERIFPLQWSIDKAIIELQTGIPQITPMEWPYTNETNVDQMTKIRLSYIRGIRTLVALALFITFIGISYQIPGSVATERAMLITDHMKVMGLLDSARILSWHMGISLTYIPAWIGVGLIWKYLIFTEANTGLVVGLHLLLGLVLASWSFVIAVPFNRSPQLAAIVSTFLAIILAILGLILRTSNTVVLFVFSVLFPPSFYIFALKAICGYENNQLSTDIMHGDPDSQIVLLPLLIAAAVGIFLWPIVALVLERCLYEAFGPRSAHSPRPLFSLGKDYVSIPDSIAISIRNLTKIYKISSLNSKKDVTAITNLDLDIPKTGIFVMLGSNGAGKSTALSMLGGLQRFTKGTIKFEGGHSRPPRGALGIVPQKNVLFPHLTCIQNLRVWRAVKWSDHSALYEDLEQLLHDCDLQDQINSNAAILSGGQKRKLQLAIGLLGGSKIVLVDECTAGVDPLSRRAIWKILTSFREDRCIVFTTHFLDEADLLADHIVVLAPPGKVVASGSPVALKRDLGEGYTIQVSFKSSSNHDKTNSYLVDEILDKIRKISPRVYIETPAQSTVCYHTKTRDSNIVSQILDLLDVETASDRILCYDILGTTIEDIFLDLMSGDAASEKRSSEISSLPLIKSDHLDLPTGRHVSCFAQAWTIFRKRLMIFRRSWLGPILTVIIAVAGACIPLVFILGKQQQCVQALDASSLSALWLPDSSVVHRVLVSPSGIVDSTLGNRANQVQVVNFPNNKTFVAAITQNFHDIAPGGVSFNTNTGASLIAWEATPPGLRGAIMLNFASNILYNRALDNSGLAGQRPTVIHSNYATFPRVAAATLLYLRWMFFFGAVMAVYPAFYALYVSKERTSSVQAMQFSNGLTNPIGLWLGHLMFDTISLVLLSTIIVIVFAEVSDQFYGLGFLWLTLVLYGISGALFAYCLSLIVSSPLAAFSIVAGYQFVMFVLYLSSYLFILTFGEVAKSSRLINIVHFSVSVVAPVASITRAALVSTNIFSLACSGQKLASGIAFGSIERYGGPIVYLIVYSFVLLAVLFWVDAGSRKSLVPSRNNRTSKKPSTASPENVEFNSSFTEAHDHLLRVLNISKKFHGKQAMEEVNLDISRDTIFALLGPNGAGKTTTFNVIRGDIIPDTGDVLINGHSIMRTPRTARSYLGVCPQFTAIDSQLTVRQHLTVYARLKGLRRGLEMQKSIDNVLQATSLSAFADRLATKLSGGNQRKLSLAISLLGNPLVILIDEFSTGVDPKMKREMWDVLRKVAVGKAIVVTTHSMEEASAIANHVGILSKRILAIGTTESLSARFPLYEVHFSCRTREEIIKARSLMALVPGSCMVEDATTRFEVPITDDGISLTELFKTLSTHGDFMEYTVERPSLETVFLKVVRGNRVLGEDHTVPDNIQPPGSTC